MLDGSVRLAECQHEFCIACIQAHVSFFMNNSLSLLAPKCLNYLCKKKMTEQEI